jgi:YcxB-like protein
LLAFVSRYGTMGRLRRQRDNRGAAMEVEYVLTVEDYVAFNKYQLASQPASRRHMSWVWLVLLVILLGLFLLPTLSGPKRQPPPEVNWWTTAFDISLLVVPLVLVVAFLVWGRPYLVTLQVKRVVTHPHNQKRLLGWRRTSIGPEGLAVRGEDVHLVLAWPAIRKLALTPQHAFIYITTLEAIIVPRRPFASDEEFQRFAETVRAYRQMARQAELESGPVGRKDAPEQDTGIKPEDRAGR